MKCSPEKRYRARFDWSMPIALLLASSILKLSCRQTVSEKKTEEKSSLTSTPIRHGSRAKTSTMGLESIADYNPNPEDNPLGPKRFSVDPRYKGSWWREFGVDDATAMRMNLGAANQSGLAGLAEPGMEIADIESMRRAQDPTRTARVMREQNLNQGEEWIRGVEMNLPRAQAGLTQLPTRGPGANVPIGFEGTNLSPEGKSLGRQVPSKYLIPEESKAARPANAIPAPQVPPSGTTMTEPRIPGLDEIQRTLSTFGSDAYKRGQYLRTLPGTSLTPELAKEKFTAESGGGAGAFDESKTYYGSASQVKGAYQAGFRPGMGNLKVTESSGVQWSPEQNRYIYVGPHLAGVDFEAVKKTPLQQGLQRLGGGIIGGGLGLITGGLVGAGLGAYQGVGGPLPSEGMKNWKFTPGGPPSGQQAGMEIGLGALYPSAKKYPGRMSY